MRFADRLTSLGRRLLTRTKVLHSQMIGSTQSGRDANNVPIPPRHLIYLVAGTSDVSWFLDSGKLGAQALRDVLKRNNIDIAKFNAILDFGCGVGRVCRHLPELTNAQLFGTDYNKQLIEWCQEYLPFGRFNTNQLVKRLEYKDSSFDFIFSLSIFTHLTESQQVFWLGELNRVLRPGEHLFLTTHGQSYERHIPEGFKDQYRRGELIVLDAKRAGRNHCVAFHPEKFVREVLAREWRVVDFVPEGALGNPTQDVYLLQRK